MNLVVCCVGVVLTLAASPCAEPAWGQRPICRNCDSFNDPPLPQMRSHCIYPCECSNEEPVCEAGVSAVRDGCGCCAVCPRQLGQHCDKTSVCDEHHGLYCRYPYVGADVGVCQGRIGLSCTIGNNTYRHGETFHADCRTQCTCQNGTYACSSLCPNENISPRAACEHPRLVDVPDQCCREWMCDSTEAEHPPSCKEESSSWSPCSAACGLGTSYRMSNVNGCVLQNETRICQLRPCEALMLDTPDPHHHIRKGHECKATRRVAGPVRLRLGPCHSRKRYRPRFCGHCADRPYDATCCTPLLSTTIKVEFFCDISTPFVLEEVLEHGRDLWWPDDMMAIKLTTSTQPNLRNDSLETSLDSPALKVSLENNDNILEFRKHLGWPEDEDSERSMNAIDVYHLDSKQWTASLESTTEEITTQATTPKLKKRRKKPRKPYTSWLEFRDEEYQMDEYEDYDDAQNSRNEKRSKRDLETLRRQYSRKVGLERGRKNTTTKSRMQSLSEIPKLPVNQSKIKSVSDFRMYKTIKSHIRKQSKPPVTPSMMQSRRKWRERDKARKKEEKERAKAKQRKGKNNRLSKIERIIRGKGKNVTISHRHDDSLVMASPKEGWRTPSPSSSQRRKRRSSRNKRTVSADNYEPYVGGGYRQSVQLNVEWIVKCGCDRACAHHVTTTPSDALSSEDGEIVLRRVHRTAPP